MIYISKTGNKLNGKPYSPELITPKLCLNPLYPNVIIGSGCEILLDSGAYQDEDIRLSFEGAYQRQVLFQQRIGFKAKYIVAYDKMGNMEVTIEADKFLLNRILPEQQEKILVVQGSTDSEYSECLCELLTLYSKQSFVIGFGGVAKAGINKSIELRLYNAIKENIETISNVKHIHIFGCFTTRILKTVCALLPDCEVSCDTASCEMRSVMGNIFVSGNWIKTYERVNKYIDYHPCELALDNVRRAIGYYEGDTIYRYCNLAEGV